MGGGGDPKLAPDTEEAKALAEVSARRFNRYQQAFVPLENEYIGDVMDVRQQGTYESVGGLASAAYTDQFGQANKQLETEMMQQGVDPSSGVYVGNSASLRKAQALKQGMGVAGAKTANTDRFYQGLSGLVAMGQGQSSDAIGGLTQLAGNATDTAMKDAQSSFQSASGARAGIGTFAGLAASPYVDSMTRKSVSSASSKMTQPASQGTGS